MKRLLALVLVLCMVCTLLPVSVSAATKLDSQPYANIEYGYSAGVSCGTIRYISQQPNRSSYFYDAYWGSWKSSATGECCTASISMALSYVGINKTPNDILNAHDGQTVFYGWGVNYESPSIATGVDRYVSGDGKWSPLIIHLNNYPGASAQWGHWVTIVGKVSSNVYQIADPSNDSVWNMTINGTSASYMSRSDNIDRVYQYYNPNASGGGNTGNYLSKCTYYPAYCTIKTTKQATMKSFPCSAGTDSSSKDIVTVDSGTSLTATALYKNTKDNYWYKVSYNGKECYIFSNNVSYEKHLTSDVGVSGEVSPSSIEQGSKFSIGGVVTSKYNQMIDIGGYIFKSGVEKISANAIFKDSSSVSNNSYSLKSSIIDKALKFGELSAGTYWYMIEAHIRGYYCTDGTTLKYEDYWSHPIDKSFSVVGSSQPALTVVKTTNHKYSVTIPANYLLKNYTSPTDTNAISSNYVLAKSEPYTLTCKAKYEMSDNSVRYFWTSGDTPPKDLYFIFDSSCMSVTPKHTYTSKVTAPTCTAQGYTTYTCSCGDTYKSNYVSALGHDYKNGSCTRCGKEDPSYAGGKCGDNVTWTLKDGVLTISGTGDMYDWRGTDGFNAAPWEKDHLKDIKSVKIDYGVTSIGDCAFSNCIGLTSITIPTSIAFIGDEAFKDCSALMSVTIPNSVKKIGADAFKNCSGLTSVIIPGSVTQINNGVFFGCSSLTNVTIPDSVTFINGTAFQGCSSLTSMTIPQSVTWIGISVFSGCTSLTRVSIPNSVTRIGEAAFKGCISLESLTIPNSVTKIDAWTFSGCSALKSIIIPNSITYIGDGAFSECTGLTSVTIPDSVTSIGGSAFSGCTGLTSVTIPNSVTSIGGYAFFGCSSLTSVTIPDGVTSICEGMFYNCTALTSVTIPNSVTSIGRSSFYCCTGLTSVTIPNGVKSIGEFAFIYCTGLKSVIIFSTITSIGDDVFSFCARLTDIYYTGSASQWESVEIGDSNSDLLNATIHYNYVTPHEHSYESTVTKPTCTAQGFTMHTCPCGDNFVDSYTDALGHDYKDGKCSRCGADDPNYKPVKENPFVDVSDTAVYFDAVLWAADSGITSGYTATEFKPGNPCTRGQVVTFLWRAAGCPEPSGDNPFVDVENAGSCKPYYNAIVWAAEQGITTGLDATHFAPNATVTRAQFVTFLWRYEGKPASNGSIGGFADAAKIATPFRDAVAWAVEKGITTGYGDGTFRPTDTCTRWAVVLFMYRDMK